MKHLGVGSWSSGGTSHWMLFVRGVLAAEVVGLNSGYWVFSNGIPLLKPYKHRGSAIRAAERAAMRALPKEILNG